MLSEIDTRTATAADLDSIVDLMLRARRGPTTHAAWRWLLSKDAAGCEVEVAESDGRIVSAVVLRTAEIALEDASETWCEVVLCVDEHSVDESLDSNPKWVGLLDRALHSRLGPATQRLAFTRERASRWAPFGSAGFEFVRRDTRLVHNVEPGADELPAPVDGFELERLVDAGSEIEELSARVARGKGASFRRDADFVDWRFRQHPCYDYRLLSVRWEGNLVGYVVLLPRGEDLVIVDWQVPDWEERPGGLLLEATRSIARSIDALRLTASVPEWSPWFARFQASGFHVQAGDRVLAIRKTSPRQDTYWVRDTCWYQDVDTLIY